MEHLRIPIGRSFEWLIDLFTEHFSFITIAFSEVTENGIKYLVKTMMFFPPWTLIVIFTCLAWFLSRRRGIALFTVIGLSLIWNMGLWAPTMSTIALVLISTLMAILIGMPLGIFSALNRAAYRIIMPILDVMQTMPAFVYPYPGHPAVRSWPGRRYIFHGDLCHAAGNPADLPGDQAGTRRVN